MEPTSPDGDHRPMATLAILAAAGLLSLCLLAIRPAYLPAVAEPHKED